MCPPLTPSPHILQGGGCVGANPSSPRALNHPLWGRDGMHRPASAAGRRPAGGIFYGVDNQQLTTYVYAPNSRAGPIAEAVSHAGSTQAAVALPPSVDRLMPPTRTPRCEGQALVRLAPYGGRHQHGPDDGPALRLRPHPVPQRQHGVPAPGERPTGAQDFPFPRKVLRYSPGKIP